MGVAAKGAVRLSQSVAEQARDAITLPAHSQLVEGGLNRLPRDSPTRPVRQLRRGGAVVDVFCSDRITPVLADELRVRGITINGLAPGPEPPRAHHDGEDLVALSDRWRCRSWD